MALEKLIDKKYILEKTIQLEGGDVFTREGWTAVPNCILETPILSSSAKLVYCMILRRAQAKDYCFPGQERIGKDLGMSERTVREAIKELEKSGCLKMIRRGQGKTNIYKLPMRKLDKILKKKSVEKPQL